MKIGIWNECDYDRCDLVLRLVEMWGLVFLCAVDEDGNVLDSGYVLGVDHTDGTISLCELCEVPGLKTDHHGGVVVYAETDSGIRPLNPGGGRMNFTEDERYYTLSNHGPVGTDPAGFTIEVEPYEGTLLMTIDDTMVVTDPAVPFEDGRVVREYQITLYLVGIRVARDNERVTVYGLYRPHDRERDDNKLEVIS